jgi:hypothetical protein
MCVEIKIGEGLEEKKAIEVAQAVIDIVNTLSTQDVIELAELLKKNPSIVKTAKAFLGK